MKKYIKPSIELVAIENEAVMAASSFTVNGYDRNGTHASKRNNYDPTDDWGDEDEEY